MCPGGPSDRNFPRGKGRGEANRLAVPLAIQPSASYTIANEADRFLIPWVRTIGKTVQNRCGAAAVIGHASEPATSHCDARDHPGYPSLSRFSRGKAVRRRLSRRPLLNQP